jgi:vacuolar-type H+-ATPase subunit E/Vma4
MSLEAILAAIEAAGEIEVARLRAEAEGRVRQSLSEAEKVAGLRREEARREALRPVAGERARRLHQAKVEALRIGGEVRERLVQTALSEARNHLARLRDDLDYPLIQRGLIEEAIGALGDEVAAASRCRLEVDQRDAALVRRILEDLGLDLKIALSLHCWGGVVAHSADDGIVATNTLEARLERATPFLRRRLAGLFEAGSLGGLPAPEAITPSGGERIIHGQGGGDVHEDPGPARWVQPRRTGSA